MPDAPRIRGWYFDEFQLGQQIESPSRTITEADVQAFADISGDYNPLHMDADYARETAFGQRIAHGLLGLSAASGLAAAAGFMADTVQAFTGLSWKFKAPIFFGDTIFLRAKVARLRAMPSMGGGMLVLEAEVLNQRQEVVQQGEWNVLIKARPA
jgi:acyl dehydratase